MSAGKGGGAASSPDGSPAPLDGAFLLQMLRNPPRATAAVPPPPPPPREDPHRHPHDPPVRAVGPSVPFLPHNFFPPPTNPMPVPSAFHQPPWFPPGFSSPPGPAAGARLPVLQQPGPPAAEDRRRDFGFSPRDGVSVNHARHNSGGTSQGRAEIDSRQQKAHIARTPSLADRNHYRGEMVRSGPAASVEFQRPGVVDRGRQLDRKHYRGELVRSGPAASVEFQRLGVVDRGRQLDQVRRGSGEWVPMNESRERKSNTEVPQKVPRGRNMRIDSYSRMEGVKSLQGVSLGSDQGWQLDQSMKAIGNSRLSDDGPQVEDSVGESQDENGEDAQGSEFFAAKAAVVEEDVLAEQVEESLIIGDDSAGKSVISQVRSSRSKTQEIRFDSLRGHHVSSQRMRIRRRMMARRHDIETSTPLFLSIFESLIPAAEEKAKQKQLLLSLEKLVNEEWPNAQLHLYGSCANSFGVLKSDIDVCLAINEDGMSRSEILLKLADILQSDNLANVQALTHARVPIVKLMDPVTGISCDICLNNLLAVVNTKLLRDYAQIDDRLRQLAFIVKHWAKSRGVNETYRGTLSSYAYVLMCIHFLQLRKPAILPCLQQMEATYIVTVDETECAYFDKVERLRNFGSQNKESIAQLLWAFFHYWAYCHDYVNDVISVRTGSILSKRVKDWTRRIGNDRHLICIEDPFEVSHDLGRVVDKYSIKILREEFERAADILQYDPNPSVTLFEPYVPGSPHDQLLQNLEHQS